MRRSNEPRQTDAGGGFASVRGAYEQIGPDEFYTQHGLQYSNPHGAVLESTLREALTTWTDLVVAQKRLRLVLQGRSSHIKTSKCLENCPAIAY